MRLSSQNNQFIFQLPLDFLDSDLEKQFKNAMYKNYIPYSNIMSYINSTIKEIVFPNVSFNNVEQIVKYGKVIQYKDSKNIWDNFTREIDITFRSVDSHLNYFILLQIITKFQLNNELLHIPNFLIQILDKDGDLLYTVKFEDILLKSISEKRLAYNASVISEDTFSITFAYNFVDIIWELDNDGELQNGKSIFDIPLNEPDSKDSSRVLAISKKRALKVKELLKKLK